MKLRSQRFARVAIAAALVLPLGACRAGPTLDEAEGMLKKGDPEGALEAARVAGQSERDPSGIGRAKRVAFEAGLALGRTDLAARELLDLEPAAKERDQLLERLAGTTLLAALASPDAGRRAAAAGCLVLAAPHPKLSRLVDRALEDEEPGVREATLPAVFALAGADGSVSRLARLAGEDPSLEVREAAAQALALRLTAIKATNAAIDPAELEGAQAVLARRALSPTTAGPTTAGPGTSGSTTPPSSVSSSSVPSDVRPPLTFGLGSPEAELSTALADRGYEVRLAAIHAIGERLRAGHPGGWPMRLATVVHDDPVEPVRLAAVDALGLDREQRAVLASLSIGHRDPATRREAFLAGDRIAPFAFAELAERLEDRDPAIAPEAARLLGERGGTAALGPLVRALAYGPRAERLAAAHALGSVGGEGAATALVHALDARDAQVRRAAAEGLARVGGSSVREDLLRTIARPEGEADVAAASAILATFAHPAGAGTGQESP